MDGEIITDEEEIRIDLASVGSRFISYLIDYLILVVIWLILMPLLWILGIHSDGVVIIIFFLYMLFWLGYFTYFFGNGQTPGMKAMKIRLIGTDGRSSIGYGKGLLRLIGMMISGMVFDLGFIWILIDKKKQGWHDKIAGTYVVNA